ncbi:uncharacterized protein PHACADRAFT_125379 [Phanerochaete carnosa HHB-10118-sp]|uniref:Uncharacterized protein n=1 Tax=Phanerochaete carnosa (strain HHB-10118-sp) TaxID=650164 RepID=K5WT17_PHACS|nr:uncharacterized protein PHACADRAFT_125379 [Phanerochaete carnosa HHB-10118-sp]EKM53572.1 hypothetical protein PHACADRAFT_125379 [Phanerochaete carnosa HHB-10118-sp]
MPAVSGANLPPELLSHILIHAGAADVWSRSLDERRRLKRGLLAPSLVCKHWSEVVRSYLFRELAFRSPDDVRFLVNIIDSPQFRASSLSRVIHEIQVHQDGSETKPWLHHIHLLSSRLPRTNFLYVAAENTDDAGPWRGPFHSLPRTPPTSNLQLSELTLDGLRLPSKTALARIIDTFPTLEQCFCLRLTFLDSSPVTQSRRPRRRFSSSLTWCEVSRCKEVSFPDQAMLASDILAASARLNIDNDTWITALQAFVAFAPETFDKVTLNLGPNGVRIVLGMADESSKDAAGCIRVEVYVYRPSVSPGLASPPSRIKSITLRFCYDIEDVESLPLDGLHSIVDRPLVESLCVACFFEEGPEYKTFKKIVRSVLGRTQLTWALNLRKLQFNHAYLNLDSTTTSGDILSVPIAHTVNGIPITLDTSEQAEWLLSDPGDREDYLQELLTARKSTAVAGTSPGIESSVTGGTQDATQQTQHVAEIGGLGDGEELRDGTVGQNQGTAEDGGRGDVEDTGTKDWGTRAWGHVRWIAQPVKAFYRAIYRALAWVRTMVL